MKKQLNHNKETLLSQAKQHLIKLLGDKPMFIYGQNYTFEQQESIINSHLILKNYGFGYPHSYWDFAEKILNNWIFLLISANDELIKEGKTNYLEALNDYYKKEADKLFKGDNNFNDIINQLEHPLGNHHAFNQLEINGRFTFIDLFAGIGGFHQAMHSIGGRCVFASEWDKYARQTYEANYRNIAPNLFQDNCRYFNCDINDVNVDDIPNFDVCCGGFPCQAFSVAGLKRGFEDTRGTLFFNIANIVREKTRNGNPPRVLFLENVRGLKTHDKGNTLNVILATLEELGYNYSYEVLNAKYFGVPQNRERLFIIAWNNELVDLDHFRFPYGIAPDGKTIYDKSELKKGTLPTKVSDIFEPRKSIDPKFTISDRMWEGHQLRKERNRLNGKGFGYSLFNEDSPYTSTISARYWKDGSEILIDQSQFGLNPRVLTPVEAGRLQGYKIIGNGWENDKCFANQPFCPEFNIVVSKKEAYKQFGNSVALPVVRQLAKEILNQLLM